MTTDHTLRLSDEADFTDILFEHQLSAKSVPAGPHECRIIVADVGTCGCTQIRNCCTAVGCDWETEPDGTQGDEHVAHLNALLAARVQPALGAARAEAWDEGVKAAFRGAIVRQNADDVKRTNPYRDGTAPPRAEAGVPVAELEALADRWRDEPNAPGANGWRFDVERTRCAGELRALIARALGRGGRGMSHFDYLEDFAGPGGWDEGARALGLAGVGIEYDTAACRTAVAAGHRRIQADVATYPSAPFDGIPGYIASPPCQAWSMAGKRKGELDRANCHTLADRMANGDDSTDWTEWEDPRSPLVCQPVRRVRELRPEWIALEEVPAVLGLWEHFARIFRGWGYSVWTGVLNSADYGVPQARQRVILMASRVRQVQPPEPTHSRDGDDGGLFGDARDKWVSMAAALGWGFDAEPSCTVSSGGAETGGAEPYANADYRKRLAAFVAAGVTGEGRPKDVATQPADTLTGKGTAYWVQRERSGDRAEEGFEATENPAQCLTSKTRSWTVWPYERPSTTVQGDPRIGRPGHKDFAGGESQYTKDSVRVTVTEGGVLQSFPADYPWQGSRSKQYQQVGNAIPPLLAAHILSALTGAAIEVAA